MRQLVRALEEIQRSIPSPLLPGEILCRAAGSRCPCPERRFPGQPLVYCAALQDPQWRNGKVARHREPRETGVGQCFRDLRRVYAEPRVSRGCSARFAFLRSRSSIPSGLGIHIPSRMALGNVFAPLVLARQYDALCGSGMDWQLPPPPRPGQRQEWELPLRTSCLAVLPAACFAPPATTCEFSDQGIPSWPIAPSGIAAIMTRCTTP